MEDQTFWIFFPPKSGMNTKFGNPVLFSKRNHFTILGFIGHKSGPFLTKLTDSWDEETLRFQTTNVFIKGAGYKVFSVKKLESLQNKVQNVIGLPWLDF